MKITSGSVTTELGEESEVEIELHSITIQKTNEECIIHLQDSCSTTLIKMDLKSAKEFSQLLMKTLHGPQEESSFLDHLEKIRGSIIAIEDLHKYPESTG